MLVKTNFSLKKYNTFALDSIAKFYAAPESTEEIRELLVDSELISKKKLILGGGSNMLFVNDFDGLVIHSQLKGKSIISKKGDKVKVKAFAGEQWDEFVEWTVNQGLGGLENLSLIPGTVGACPVQNIGAYGVEVGELIDKVQAIHIETGLIREFSKQECHFGYRNSVFKNELCNQFIICSVEFNLSNMPEFITHYGQIEAELKTMSGINLQNVRQAVINIRQSKLPDPQLTPNAGSFFKNPVISKKKADDLKNRFPEMVIYPVDDETTKLAAGWLIDKLGWKGKVHKGAAVHINQALVLVNHKQAKGTDILELAEQIKKSVEIEFGIHLEFEVNIV